MGSVVHVWQLSVAVDAVADDSIVESLDVTLVDLRELDAASDSDVEVTWEESSPEDFSTHVVIVEVITVVIDPVVSVCSVVVVKYEDSVSFEQVWQTSVLVISVEKTDEDLGGMKSVETVESELGSEKLDVIVCEVSILDSDETEKMGVSELSEWCVVEGVSFENSHSTEEHGIVEMTVVWSVVISVDSYGVV